MACMHGWVRSWWRRGYEHCLYCDAVRVHRKDGTVKIIKQDYR